jgi:hypothetical protein
MLNNSSTDGPFGVALENNNSDDDIEFYSDANEESESESLSLSRYAPLFCLQMITSFLSILASVIVIRMSFNKLCGSYQRYLFMLNITIVINSLFLGLHLLLVPTEITETYSYSYSYSYWAVGNKASCTAAGFFIVFGSLVVSMYHTAIAFYFYCSIQPMRNKNNSYDQKTKNGDDDNRDTKTKKKTNKQGSEEASESSKSKSTSTSESSQEDDVIGSTEMITNMSCWFFPAVTAGIGATFNYFRYEPNLDMCLLYDDSFTSYYGKDTDETTWIRIINNIFRWALVICAVAIILITVMIFLQVRGFHKRNNGGSDTTAQQTKDNSLMDDPDAVADAQEKQLIGQKLTAVSAQCLLYMLSYLISFIWFIILMFIPTTSNINVLYAFQLLTALLYPLQGVFNCIIYVRPRVQMLQIMYPQDSFIIVLRVAISKAGDPDEIEVIRAKLYGREYSRPEKVIIEQSLEDHDDPGRLKGLPIPSVVTFDSNVEVSTRSLVSALGADDDKKSTQINNPQKP